jgi:hypothetical protein
MVRYDMYHLIKTYIRDHGTALSEDKIYDIAQQISFITIYKKVFELFEVAIEYDDVILTMKKMDSIFQQ